MINLSKLHIWLVALFTNTVFIKKEIFCCGQKVQTLGSYSTALP